MYVYLVLVGVFSVILIVLLFLVISCILRYDRSFVILLLRVLFLSFWNVVVFVVYVVLILLVFVFVLDKSILVLDFVCWMVILVCLIVFFFLDFVFIISCGCLFFVILMFFLVVFLVWMIFL